MCRSVSYFRRESMTPFLSPESQWDSISSKDRPCKGKTDIIVEKPARLHPADEGSYQ